MSVRCAGLGLADNSLAERDAIGHSTDKAGSSYFLRFLPNTALTPF